MNLAVVIPVFNEVHLLRDAIERLDAVAPPSNVARTIVLIDDGSTDGTREIVASIGERDDVIVRLHDRNRGKGAALATGFEAALESGCDLVLVHDADLEYDPADHEAVLDPILSGRADVVIGTRFGGTTQRVLYFWHSVANRIITLCSNMATNLNLSDIECCSKAFTREVLEHLKITEPRFGVEPEIVARVARMRLEGRPLRIYEVPVTYAGRTYAEGKKIGWKDAVRAIWCIVRY